MRGVFIWGPLALLLLGGVDLAKDKWAAPSALAQLATSDDWDGLPQGPGREEVFGICRACHSLMIVKQQGLTREAWDETLVWMVEEQGMPELDDEYLNLVLDYLASHYGPDRRNR